MARRTLKLLGEGIDALLEATDEIVFRETNFPRGLTVVGRRMKEFALEDVSVGGRGGIDLNLIDTKIGSLLLRNVTIRGSLWLCGAVLEDVTLQEVTITSMLDLTGIKIKGVIKISGSSCRVVITDNKDGERLLVAGIQFSEKYNRRQPWFRKASRTFRLPRVTILD